MNYKKTFLAMVSGLALTCSAHGQDTGTSSDENQLRQLKEVLWPQAYREQDVALLDKILDPSFEMVGEDGRRFSKADEIASLPDSTWPHDAFSFYISRLDIYDGQFAIVSGEGRGKGKNAEGPYCFVYQSSNVLHKTNHQWKAVASHVSGVKDC